MTGSYKYGSIQLRRERGSNSLEWKVIVQRLDTQFVIYKTVWDTTKKKSRAFISLTCIHHSATYTTDRYWTNLFPLLCVLQFNLELLTQRSRAGPDALSIVVNFPCTILQHVSEFGCYSPLKPVYTLEITENHSRSTLLETVWWDSQWINVFEKEKLHMMSIDVSSSRCYLSLHLLSVDVSFKLPTSADRWLPSWMYLS